MKRKYNKKSPKLKPFSLLTKLAKRLYQSPLNKIVDKRVKTLLKRSSTINTFHRPSGDTAGAIIDPIDIVVRREPIKTSRGTTEKPMPLGVGFHTLREFALFYPIARACIEYRKSQITQLDWTVAPMEVTKETFDDPKNVSRVKELKDFFKHPVGKAKKEFTFTNWIKQVLEDLLVIDAVALYRLRNRRDDIIGYLPIDGATIELILNLDGTLPEPPRVAYAQRVQGKLTATLNTDELIYTMMTPRTNNPFGLAPLETLVITVTTALKLDSFNLSYLTEGNVPEGFVKVPRDIASSRDQLKEWQQAWDAMLSGDPRFQRKLKFLPEGMDYEPTVKPADMTFERFEKWLLQNTCAVFGVQPAMIGFNFETNRSTSETSFEVVKERGLFPTALFIKELMDRIIQDDLGFDDLNFRWTNINPTNKLDEAKVTTSLVSKGLLAIDEWRVGEGLRPIGLDEPFIETPIGPIFVKDLAAQSESGQMPILPYKPPAEAAAASEDAGGAAASPNVPHQAKPHRNKTETINELRRWRRASINDFKQNKSPREFKTDIISLRTQDLIKGGLKKSKNIEDIDNLFNPFISEQYSIASSLLNFYDELNKTINARPVKKTFSNTA